MKRGAKAARHIIIENKTALSRRRVFQFIRMFRIDRLSGLSGFLASLVIFAAFAAEGASLEAGAAILMNTKSESVLYVQNEDAPIPPASLTKIMTMFIALDAVEEGRVSLEDQVTVSRRAASQQGSRMNLSEGDVLTLDELLLGAAVASGNDAAVAIAEHVSGSVDSFRQLMNDKAAELGMSRTVFRNPNGLPSDGQMTTASDMLTLAKNYIESHHGAMRYHNIPAITYNGKATTNRNPLLRMYPFADGLKTGWTTASRHNLIGTAISGDVRLISVVLGAPTSNDLAYASAFLVESGFRTVESGGALKVAAQLDALIAGTSPDIVPEPGTTVYTIVPPEASAPDEEDTDEAGSLPDGVPPRLEFELEFEYDFDYEIDPGDDTEFDEMEFDDPSVWWGDAGFYGAPGRWASGGLREIEAREIIEAVEALCVEANFVMADDIRSAAEDGIESEDSEAARGALSQLALNADAAAEGDPRICHDTGMVVVFVEVGQDVRIRGGSLRDAVNEGVRRGYKNGYLRASVVADPIDRVNTGDNTPAVMYFDIVPGDRVRIVVSPKGFGNENMSRAAMLTPADGIAGIKRFVIETVLAAGSDPCPPITVGVGVGGTIDYAAFMAKQALLRPVGSANGSWLWDGIERGLLEEINLLGAGPATFGGLTTALAVHIKTYPTHTSGLPVAVSIGCHLTGHFEMTL